MGNVEGRVELGTEGDRGKEGCKGREGEGCILLYVSYSCRKQLGTKKGRIQGM